MMLRSLTISQLQVKDLEYEVMPSEEAVGRAMLDEIKSALAAKEGSLVMILVGGRGGQALHRLLGAMAKTSDHDALFSRLPFSHRMRWRRCDWITV